MTGLPVTPPCANRVVFRAPLCGSGQFGRGVGIVIVVDVTGHCCVGVRATGLWRCRRPLVAVVCVGVGVVLLVVTKDFRGPGAVYVEPGVVQVFVVAVVALPVCPCNGCPLLRV